VVHMPQFVRSLTRCLSKASPGAYSTYRNEILSLLYFSMHVLYCALCIGFLNEVVISCLVVLFHMYPWFRSIYLYMIRCAMLS
jgi:hypothetical protein